MANEVVNPFQLYRDEKGVPLAGGNLRILQPGTSALGTAFSDSALTVPQVVDGYVLDAYGRVTGDLKWPGIRDVEVYAAGSPARFIRTDSDNVTLIDSSDFAINVATVAAMIANLTLVLGDVVETQNYLAATQKGGARYLIVAGGTGTEDSYIFHDLDNGLQARLIDQEANNNFYVAGAVGDGTADDTLPVQRLLTIGGDIECANGIFACAALTLSVAARLYGNGTLLRFPFSNTDLINLTGNDLFITFDGLILDGNLANQSTEQAIAIVNSAVLATSGITFSFVHFNNVQFQNGSQYDVLGDGADDGFPVLYSFAQCNFIGGEEGSASFAVGSVVMQDGVNCSIEDCYWNLTVTATTGRPAVRTQSNDGLELTNPGTLSVSASTLIGMGLEAATLADSRGAIDARQVDNLIVQANRILNPQCGGIVFDAGVDTVTICENLVNTLTTSAVAFGAIAAVVSINAAPGDNWQIDNNTIPNSGAEAINLDGSSAGNDASRIQVNGNIIDGPTLQAILFHNLENVAIQNNYINMESLATINAVEVNTDGVQGEISVEGNEISNVDGTAILANLASVARIVIDGNTIQNVNTACIDVQNFTGAIITNNSLIDVLIRLIQVGTLTDCYIDGNSYIGAAPTGFPTNLGAITNLLVGENLIQQVATTIRNIAVAGANQTVGPVVAHQQEFIVTGASSIDTLQDPGVDGWIVVLQSDGAAALTFNDGLGNMNLGANRVLGDATDTLTLMWNETNTEWNQLAFADN